MDEEIAQLTETVNGLRKGQDDLLRRLETLEGKKDRRDTASNGEAAVAEPMIRVFDLKGFCVSGGRIFLHETGYCGEGSLSATETLFYVPSSDVERNRQTPSEQVERVFSVLANRQRVTLLRALSERELKTSNDLKGEAGLTDGQFYHHIRDLFSTGYVVRGAQDQYRLTERGKTLIIFAEALANDLAR